MRIVRVDSLSIGLFDSLRISLVNLLRIGLVESLRIGLLFKVAECIFPYQLLVCTYNFYKNIDQ